MRLYQPVQGPADSSEDEDESLLPLHRSPTSRNKLRENVWDASDPYEIFAIADDEDEEPAFRTGASFTANSNIKTKAPQIVITAPSTASGEFSR